MPSSRSAASQALERGASVSRTHSSSPPRRKASPAPAPPSAAARRAAQELVARRVAEAVVVALEAVEVEEHEQLALATVDGGLEGLHQRAAVAEAGQRRRCARGARGSPAAR